VKEYLQLTADERKELENHFLREPDAFYEKAETDLLRDALKRSYMVIKEQLMILTFG
jgi:hypothetical protein